MGSILRGAVGDDGVRAGLQEGGERDRGLGSSLVLSGGPGFLHRPVVRGLRFCCVTRGLPGLYSRGRCFDAELPQEL